MKWHWIASSLIIGLNFQAAATIVINDLDEKLFPVERIVTLTQKPKTELFAISESTTKEAPQIQILPESHWQDTFFRCHHSGYQHLLICATDPELFGHYLAALIRLLECNPHCRVTFMAPEEEHENMRKQLYVLIRDQVKCNSSVLRDLHFVDQPFTKKSRDRKFSMNAINGDKYHGILLACPRGDYKLPMGWLHNQNAVLYIPYTRAPQNIEKKLHESGIRTHCLIRTAGMICAATSDFTSFPNAKLYPAYNPARNTPIFLRKELPPQQCPVCGPNAHGHDKIAQAATVPLNIEDIFGKQTDQTETPKFDARVSKKQ